MGTSKCPWLLKKVLPAAFTGDKVALTKCFQNAFSGMTIPLFFVGEHDPKPL